MKKQLLKTKELTLNKKVIAQFESQKIIGACPATNNSDCVTKVDWVCNHTKPDRCQGAEHQIIL